MCSVRKLSIIGGYAIQAIAKIDYCYQTHYEIELYRLNEEMITSDKIPKNSERLFFSFLTGRRWQEEEQAEVYLSSRVL